MEKGLRPAFIGVKSYTLASTFGFVFMFLIFPRSSLEEDLSYSPSAKVLSVLVSVTRLGAEFLQRTDTGLNIHLSLPAPSTPLLSDSCLL